jgi:hypothetical protein
MHDCLTVLKRQYSTCMIPKRWRNEPVHVVRDPGNECGVFGLLVWMQL